MGTYTNEATAQQDKATTPKTEVLQALGECRAALLDCAAVAGLAGEPLRQLANCMEEMRKGVAQVEAVIRREWPEQ